MLSLFKKNISKEVKHIYFSYSKFSRESFIYKLTSLLDFNTSYSLYIKLSYNNISDFKMCGSQIGLSVLDNHDIQFYHDLFDVINIRIEHTFENYVMIDSIDTIELTLFTVDSLPELKLKNISKLKVPKYISKFSSNKSFFSDTFLPLTSDLRYYGEKITNIDLCNTYLDKIQKMNDSIEFSIENLRDFDSVFIYSSKHFKNKEKNRKFIIISKVFDNNFNKRYTIDRYCVRFVFDFATGIYLFRSKDIILNSENDHFIRSINNTSLDIKNQSVNNLKININLKSFTKPIKFNKQITSKNEEWGVFDIETYKNKEGINKIYAVGFLVNGYKDSNLYYIGQDLDSNSLLIRAINEMLVPRFNNFIFYCHNFGKYDAVFIYKILLEYNKNVGYDYFILNSILRDGVILRLDVKIKFNNKFIKISFLDSINLLKGSLASLAEDFEVSTKKSIFPYDIVNENNLFYVGNMPSLEKFENLFPNVDVSNTYWDMKLETLNYLDTDLKCLLEVLTKFNQILYNNYNTNMTDALTITRVALNIFYNNHEDKIKNIPLINKMDMFNFIKQGYFGGITEVYSPYGEDLYYLDVNSLYPFASINNPLPGGNSCNYIESLSEKGLDLEDLFGFFYAIIETNNNYFGLLPVRSENNLVIFPNGKFSGVWSSEELKFAKENGYKVKVIKGYNFSKVYNIFEGYVSSLYETKLNSQGATKATAKSLLNNLIGRLGLNSLKPKTEIVDSDKFKYISSTRKIHSYQLIANNSYLISYDSYIDKNICNEHSLDYEEIIDREKSHFEKGDKFKDVSIPIAAMVTSYARIFMNKLKLSIFNKGGKIFYMDTDSLVLDKVGFNYLQDELNDKIGYKLGQFKIEYRIKKGIFISNKTYSFLLYNNKSIIKAKGVNNTNLTFDDFKEMYLNQNDIMTKKNNTQILYDKGSVILSTMDIVLKSDSYVKRKKIFQEDRWVDTEPVDFFS